MERCFRCFRPYGQGRECLCRFIKEIDTGVKFVFLMHPKERRRERTGTGQLAHISLVSSSLFVALDFSTCTPFMSLLHDARYTPVLLYPGDKEHIALNAFSMGPIEKTLLVIVLDATWFCARKIIEHNPYLLDLPRLSFFGDYRSEYRFKREPAPKCISTIESCYYLIEELKAAGVIKDTVDPSSLMVVFRRMVQNQIDAQNARVAGLLPSTHAYDWKYKKRFEG